MPRTFGAGVPKVELRTQRKYGISGSLLFHAGVLLLILAGAGRALFSAEAVVDVMEGETLPATAGAWGAQWPGLLARPICLKSPVSLKSIDAEAYGDGSLRTLGVELSVDKEEKGLRRVEVNQGTHISGIRVYLGSDYGPALLAEWISGEGNPTREAVLLNDKDSAGYEGLSKGPGGLVAHFRAVPGRAGQRSGSVEVRIMRENALLYADRLAAGGEAILINGEKFRLHGMPYWVRLRASRDPVLWLAYAGFSLVLAGAAVMFMVVRVDTCVSVSPENGQERVFVAVRAQRFAPLYREQFRRLVREQGGEE